ncbi:hypothetical protein [Maribacter aquivivus]|uniref:hypothetical protein n=1 Tax=Maribacter aquivivus TaxID=228958 RepID=UPI0024914155|nr:hypothetical protein [Maribacter aquivivus]
MRKPIILLVLFFAQLCFGQEKEISKSFLIDRWKVDKTKIEGDTEITVYRRSRTLKIGNELRFLSTGEYRITFNSGRRIGRRCGNEIRTEGINGYYRFNSQEQSVTLESYNTDPIINWSLVWIDENSFGVKKAKDNITYN